MIFIWALLKSRTVSAQNCTEWLSYRYSPPPCQGPSDPGTAKPNSARNGAVVASGNDIIVPIVTHIELAADSPIFSSQLLVSSETAATHSAERSALLQFLNQSHNVDRACVCEEEEKDDEVQEALPWGERGYHAGDEVCCHEAPQHQGQVRSQEPQQQWQRHEWWRRRRW